MIHLDTHVVVWLASGQVERVPPVVRAAVGAVTPIISPAVVLELSLLHEIGRITRPAADVVERLERLAGLRVASSPFERVVRIAAGLTWTRDPFDRLIVASALADDLPLVTKDTNIRAHCPLATW